MKPMNTLEMAFQVEMLLQVQENQASIIESQRAEIARLREVLGIRLREVLGMMPFDRNRFDQAPCYLCGYNSHDYYQPDVHPCAAMYLKENP
jgi:hypothetical protein